MTGGKSLPGRWTLLMIAVPLLVFLRSPGFFLRPRVWAEEGTVYVQACLDHGIASSLVRPHLGYYSFFNKWAVALSLKGLGLELLPYGTTLLSLVALLAVATAPLWLPCPYWCSPFRKAAVLLFTLVAGCTEIWLNTINVQFYLGLFSAWLLLSDWDDLSGVAFVATLLILTNGALTGVTSVILAPFFLWKGLERWRAGLPLGRFAGIFGILAVGVAVQGTALLVCAGEPAGLQRFDLGNLNHLPWGWFRTCFAVFHNPWIGLLYLPLGLAALPRMLRSHRGAWMLPALPIYVSAIFTFTSLGMEGGERYAFVPTVIFFVLLLHHLDRETRTLLAWATGGLGVLTFAFYFVSFFKTGDCYDPRWVPYRQAYAARGSSIRIFPQWEGSRWEIRTQGR